MFYSSGRRGTIPWKPKMYKLLCMCLAANNQNAHPRMTFLMTRFILSDCKKVKQSCSSSSGILPPSPLPALWHHPRLRSRLDAATPSITPGHDIAQRTEPEFLLENLFLTITNFPSNLAPNTSRLPVVSIVSRALAQICSWSFRDYCFGMAQGTTHSCEVYGCA